MPHRPTGHCIFCDATGVTKAHVFAKSWTNLFDEPNETQEHEVVHRYTNPGTGEQHVIKRAKTFALISRKVCAKCNSGWLRELEERVKPVMADFAANTPTVLSADEQADLALWASVAILIAMSMDPDAVDFADPVLAEMLYRTGRDDLLRLRSHPHHLPRHTGAADAPKTKSRRSLRRIWGTQDRVAWPPRLRLRPRDLSPLAVIVGEQSSFERAAPRRAA